MIRPSFFYDTLASNGINFYAGVPDSLLKQLCAYITDHADATHNIIAANEGGALGVAAGHYLATRQIPVVYMQNSGEGNIINPLASLTDKDVYNIPVLLLIGWRGRPGVHDEPQHVKQGKVTLTLVRTAISKFQSATTETVLRLEFASGFWQKQNVEETEFLLKSARQKKVLKIPVMFLPAL